MKADKNFLRNAAGNLFGSRAPLSRRALLALGGAAAFFGGQTPAQAGTSHEATAGITPAVVRTSDNFAREIIEDYDSRKGNPNQRSSIAGLNGLEVITVVYNARDAITKKAGEYVLVASVRKGPNGQPDPDRVVGEKIGVYAGINSHVSSFPTLLYDAIPTLMNGQHAWTVQVNMDEMGKNNLYPYTTGTPGPDNFALTPSDFQSLSSEAGKILSTAPHHTTIQEIPLPYPAPVVGTN
jgi:hypothetical protein